MVLVLMEMMCLRVLNSENLYHRNIFNKNTTKAMPLHKKESEKLKLHTLIYSDSLTRTPSLIKMRKKIQHRLCYQKY